ncbi:uncharacterized protein si:dkey-237j10.2 [Corythoichthys intestinalis]|uniref:uncharacterized protein si:dkey-237j10.2 n=1 Tax=Corythoichthys intestinalis TaxID=161448 RepID=UPI0025A54E86|nr:uncharacterized protein si:dkey-237j10.2 [Corythoichthys intestinalis]
MLGEGFLVVLHYEKEKKNSSTSTGHKLQSSPITSQTDLQNRGQEQEEPGQRLQVVTPASTVLSIPGCSPIQTPETDPALISSSPCSLLDHYPDLYVADPGPISYDPLRTLSDEMDLYTQSCALTTSPPALPDQGYLVMGDRVNASLGLPTMQLEPMTNSLLNGLLEKKIDEVYLQHLTDNLARCNSNMGNSILHGLVPPLQTNNQLHGPDSLETSLVRGPGAERDKKISHLTTPSKTPWSSNFSTPVLRISEDVHPQ